ncbi:hypothetical protein [Xenorhabdus hominickii]|uniref:hypothetical protein n=1 Tax=Xenorhabdus hominickii TaxID=351679 RepID=UPI0014752344|nr:hypothetical protein [Xenorhabdus hominickii]
MTDDSARKLAYADTHYYDPIGREIQFRTAKGWFRRMQYYRGLASAKMKMILLLK